VDKPKLIVKSFSPNILKLAALASAMSRNGFCFDDEDQIN
jgi:hypothetical protein